jgi:hypothetical protein
MSKRLILIPLLALPACAHTPLASNTAGYGHSRRLEGPGTPGYVAPQPTPVAAPEQPPPQVLTQTGIEPGDTTTIKQNPDGSWSIHRPSAEERILGLSHEEYLQLQQLQRDSMNRNPAPRAGRQSR